MKREAARTYECLISTCGRYDRPVCCRECARPCRKRCLNSPDRCGLYAGRDDDFGEWQRTEMFAESREVIGRK